jgi:hypothetical protein
VGSAVFAPFNQSTPMPNEPKPIPKPIDVVTVLCRVCGWGRIQAAQVAMGMDAATIKSVEGSYARSDRETIVVAAFSTLAKLRQAPPDPVPEPTPKP